MLFDSAAFKDDAVIGLSLYEYNDGGRKISMRLDVYLEGGAVITLAGQDAEAAWTALSCRVGGTARNDPS